MNEFQMKCLRKLQENLSGLGYVLGDVEERKVKKSRFFDDPNAPDEFYLRTSTRSGEIEIFIYDDEAQFFGPDLDCRFEAPDFDTSEELTNRFISSLIEHLAR